MIKRVAADEDKSTASPNRHARHPGKHRRAVGSRDCSSKTEFSAPLHEKPPEMGSRICKKNNSKNVQSFNSVGLNKKKTIISCNANLLCGGFIKWFNHRCAAWTKHFLYMTVHYSFTAHFPSLSITTHVLFCLWAVLLVTCEMYLHKCLTPQRPPVGFSLTATIERSHN